MHQSILHARHTKGMEGKGQSAVYESGQKWALLKLPGLKITRATQNDKETKK
jgi:hypothetical protein